MRGVNARDLDFDAVRREFELPDAFPEEVEREAAAAQDRFADERVDARDIPFVTIDPAGARDLDQAVHLERTATGFLLRYAIADVGAFVVPDSALDLEARRRGQTVYLADGNVPLHPRSLSEGAASLLADEDRPCALWTIETDERGEIRSRRVERAVIRSRAQLDYAGVQGLVDRGEALPEAIVALPAFGEARQRLAVERGAVELRLPAQDLYRDGDTWRLRLEPRTQVDGWNAECSLTTGTAAASLMIEARVGILRTLPEADEKADGEFRAAAAALGLTWPADVSPGTYLAGLDDADVRTLALMSAATKLLRGSGYLAFDARGTDDAAPATPTAPVAGSTDEQDAARSKEERFRTMPDAPARWHAGVAAEYAHATAPLRRLADRYAIECCLAASSGGAVEPGIIAALPTVPSRMHESGRLANEVENACLDEAEAVALQGRVGETFDAAVLRPATERHNAEIFVLDPPIIAGCTGEPPAGAPLRATLTAADPTTRTVAFAAAAPTPR